MKHYELHPEEFCPAKFKIDYHAELNEEQFPVVLQGDGPCLVLAGAGSGKTRTLVYRVAYLIEKGINPKNILLVTFTNKAAKEMLNRVEVLLKCQPKGLWGGTFHHIGNLILRRYAKELGYNNKFTILDNDDAKTLLKAVMGELELNYKDKYFPKTNIIHDIISFSANSQKPITQVVEEKYSYLDPKLISVLEIIGQKTRIFVRWIKDHCDYEIIPNPIISIPNKRNGIIEIPTNAIYMKRNKITITPNSTIKYCSNCGTVNNNFTFCPNCGTNLK